MAESRQATVDEYNSTPGWTRALDEAELTVWLADEVPLLFRLIPAGEFWMGSRGYASNEEPRHLVRITRPFYISAFPVTQHQWRAVVEQFPDAELEPNPSYFKGDLHPVEQVSWTDATQWCRALQTSGLLADLRDRHGQAITIPDVGLPSEAQFEYACRARTETEYYTGDGEAALAEAGWYWQENSDHSTRPVGLRRPNEFSLYDMHGNVDEWCYDAYEAHAYKRRVSGVCDPKIHGDESSNRVVRGGAWDYSPRACRVACRTGGATGYRDWYQGFRICLFSGPCPASEQARRA